MILMESYELDDDVQIVSNESLEPELMHCECSNIIPDHCLTFAEQSLYVAEAAQAAFNEMFESIGIDELAVYESTGSVAVYEGARLDAFKEKAIGVFKKIWSAIKEAYDKVSNWFDQKFREMRQKKLNKFNADNVAKIPADRNLGKTRSYDLSENFASNTQAAANKIFNAESWTKDNISDKAENFKKTIFSSISGISGVEDLSQMKEKLKERMLGKEVEISKSYITSHMKDISDIVLSGNGKRDVKKAYNEERSNINGIIKKLKGMKSDGDTAMINVQISLLKNLCTATHTCFMVKMDARRRQYTDYMRIVGIVGSYNKKVLAKESYDFSDPDSIVEAAFNW